MTTQNSDFYFPDFNVPAIAIFVILHVSAWFHTYVQN